MTRFHHHFTNLQSTECIYEAAIMANDCANKIMCVRRQAHKSIQLTHNNTPLIAQHEICVVLSLEEMNNREDQ